MRTIAVINQKGGCGKTTTSINLAAALAESGERTLLVDMDPQGHCGLGLAVPEDQLERTMGDALASARPERFDLNEVLWQISGRLDLAPSTTSLAGLEPELMQAADRDLRLAKLLGGLSDRYGFCVIDCPPNIGLLTFNALRAAGEVIVPVDTGYFSLNGSMKQVQTLEAMAARCGHAVVLHVLANMVDAEQRISRQIVKELREHFGEQVLPTAVRYSAELREAASFGQPIGEYDASSGSAEDFARLAQHLVTLEAPAAGAMLDAVTSETVAAAGGAAPTAEAVTEQRAAVAAVASAEPGRADGGTAVATAAWGEAGSRGKSRDETAAGGGAGGSGPPMNSRVADLLERARRLSDRTAAMETSLSRDPEAARLAREDAAEADHVPGRNTAGGGANGRGGASLSRKLKRFYGAGVTSQGALFVQPLERAAERVCVAGDFNGWSPVATPLRLNRRLNVWEACVPLPPGEYRYRLIVDGQWTHDPHNEQVERTASGELTSILEVGQSG